MNSYSRISIYIFLSLITFIFLVSLYHKVPNEDEAIIAEHCHQLINTGHVKSDIYAGYGFGWEERMFFFHKLFVYTGALAEKIAGFNIYIFKSVSLFFFLALLFVLYKYVSFKNTKNNVTFFTLSLILLISHFLIFDFAFMFRPEIMMCFFGFTSFLLLEKRKINNETLYVLFGGLMAGFSTATHLNGLIYCSAGGIILLLHKEWKNALLFGLTGFMGISIYFLDILSITELKSWYNQFFNDPNVLEKPSVLTSLLNEQMRFFWDYRDASFSLLFFFVLATNFKKLKNKYPFLLTYFLLLVISLGLLAHGKTTKYGIAYLPFMAIICTECLTSLSKQQVWKKYVSCFLLAGYLIIHIQQDIKLITQKIDIEAHNKAISNLIPEKGIKLCAPAVFVFNEIDNYIIRGPIAYCHYHLSFRKGEETFQEFLNFSYKHGDQYIIIDAKTEDKAFMVALDKLQKLSVGDTIANFKLVIHQDQLWILKRI